MVKNTNAKRAKRKQHYSDTKTSPKKKQSPPHDKGRRYPASEMEKRLLDTTTSFLRDCMDRRKERKLASLSASIPPVASSAAVAFTGYAQHTAGFTTKTPTADAYYTKQELSSNYSSSLSKTADVIPVAVATVATVYEDNVISLISPDKLPSSSNTPSTPERHNDNIVQQLSGSDSDDADNVAPPHSLSPFYSVAQLRAKKIEVQHVSELVRYLIGEGEDISAKSVRSRVQRERADVRMELMQLLAGLKHTLHVLFS